MTHKFGKCVETNMRIMSINFAKTLDWKHEYDVKLWRRKQLTPNKNDQPYMPLNETPHENFLCTPMKRTENPAITLLQVKTNLIISAKSRKCILIGRKIFSKNSPKTAWTLVKLAQKTQHQRISRNDKNNPVVRKTAQLVTLTYTSHSEMSGVPNFEIQIQSWNFKTQSKSNHSPKSVRNLKPKVQIKYKKLTKKQLFND